MNILCLHPDPCMRAYKEMKGLKDKGINIILAHQGPNYTERFGNGDEIFDKIVKLPNRLPFVFDFLNIKKYNVLDKIVKENNIDLIHSHNGPDLLTVAAKRLTTIPVIHDTHDMESLIISPIRLEFKQAIKNCDVSSLINHTLRKIKWSYICKLEKEANENSDGRIYVTPYTYEIARNKYSIDEEKSIVFQNYVLQNHIPKEIPAKLSDADNEIHVVYEGAVGGIGGHRDYTTIFKKLAKNNIHIHMYVWSWDQNNIEIYKNLQKINPCIHFHGTLGSEQLLSGIAKYDFGIIPFQGSEELLDSALPNKLFEYISCGLPVLAPRYKSMEQFIEENELGIIFDNIENLCAALKNEDHSKLKKRVRDVRTNYTIEKNIYKIINLYDTVLNCQ